MHNVQWNLQNIEVIITNNKIEMVEIADVVDGDGYKRQPTNDTMRLYNSTIMSEWDKDRIDWQNTMNIVK